MKKALLITIILTLLAICICIPVSASGTATVTFDADNDTPARGATVVVTVALNGSDMAKSMMIQPVYDSSVLELQSGEWLLTGGVLTDNWSAEFGDAAIAYSSATDVNGDIFKMTFKVLDDAALGNTTIDCNVTIMNGQVSIPNATTPITIKASCTSHSYVEKVDDAYFKSGADCTHKAVYYKSCPVCGEKGTDTFETGNVLGHSWSSTYSQNAQGHYRTCTRTGCGASEDPTACSGGTKTCTTQATCTTCLTPYGTTLPHDYTNGTWKSDASGHWKKCEDCTAEDTAHKIGHNATDDNNCATAVYCTDCNYMTVAAKSHNLTVGASKNATDHIMECSNEGCNHTEDQAHNFNKKVESTDYLKNNADCTTAKTYYYSCACGHKGNTAFTVGTELGHDFENGTWVNTDANDHWKKCNRCNVEDTAHKTAHGYSNYDSNLNNTHSATCVCGKVDTKACSGNDASATCQTKAVCTVCGGGYGSFGSHDYDLTAWGYKGTDGHAHMCKTSGCTAHDAVVQHTSSGAPTENDPETCTVCNYVINPAIGHIHHTPVSEWSSNATHHWKECVGCSDQELEKGEHIYDNACDTTCNTCSYVRQITHNYTYKHNDTQHWQECSVCGDEKPNSRDNHSGGNATCADKAVCTYCSVAYGEKNANNHSKSTYHYTTNSNGTHKKIYDCCNVTVNASEACTGGSATCQGTAVCQHCNTAYGDIGAHNYDLSTWDYRAADGHAHVCKTSGCNAHDTVVAHTSSGAPTEANAEICTICQYVLNPALAHTTHMPKTEWSSDATHHWHECTGCSGQQFEKAEHIYDSACDTDCNTCGYVRTVEHSYTELKHNEIEHWYECICGMEKADSRVAHSGENATCTAKAKCSVCNTEYGEAAPHSYATEWSKNDAEHWHECACGAKSDKAKHAYGDDNTCDACRFEKESQGGTEPPSTDTTPTPVDPGTNSDDDNGSTIAIIIIACVVALGGGFVLYWFVFKKKKA